MSWLQISRRNFRQQIQGLDRISDIERMGSMIRQMLRSCGWRQGNEWHGRCKRMDGNQDGSKGTPRKEHSATREVTGRQESRGDGMAVVIYSVNYQITVSCKLLLTVASSSIYLAVPVGANMKWTTENVSYDYQPPSLCKEELSQAPPFIYNRSDIRLKC